MKVYKPKRTDMEGKKGKSKFYYYDFRLEGKRYQGSTRLTDKRGAEDYVDDLRTKIRKGEVGPDGKVEKRLESPKLKDFAQRFADAIQVRCGAKPNTVLFYASKLARLLEFEPLADARLNRIDEALIESYVQARSKQVSPASVNRELATLRRLLRLAQEWQVISRVPRIRLLPGERTREFTLSYAQERNYLEFAPQPLRDAATLLLDTGLRVGEVLALEWRDVHLEPVGAAKLGYLHVRSGKSKNAKRNVSLTARVRIVLERRYQARKSIYVFTNESGTGPLSVFTLEDQHSRVRKAQHLRDCVIHSFRHTFGTRLGEAGADTFTIMRIMGHSSVTVSQKYVHPTPEALERAFERLEALNRKALPEGQQASEMPQVPENSTVGSEDLAAAVEQVV